MNSKKMVLLGLLIVNIVVLAWSLNYLVSYAQQKELPSIAFGFIFGASLICLNLVAIKFVRDN